MVEDVETEEHFSAGRTAADIAVRGTSVMTSDHFFGDGGRNLYAGLHGAAVIVKGVDKR